jgi:HK97 family phage portal protein
VGFLTRGSATLAPRALRLDDESDVATILRVTDGGVSTKAGVAVGPDSALKCAVVYDCVRVIAEDVAKLPLILYRRTKDGRGKERATDHHLYGLLHDKPNDFQTSFEFREQMQGYLPLRGNAPALINRVRGEVREILPLHPDEVTVKRGSDWRVTYRLRGEGEDRPASDILHLRGLSTDGFRGVSVISLARESIGLAMAMQQHGSRLFANAARPSGVLTYPHKFKDEAAAKRLRESWESSVGGENMHRTALLEDGVSWQQISMNADDAQYVESWGVQLSDIPRWFRMPPHKVGIMTQATFSNIEHQALEYVIDTLMPWLVRWEQRLNITLLTAPERAAGYFFEFLVDGLLRGDIKTRMDAYAVGIQNGIWSANECRARENENPYEGGDEYRVPLNMGPASGAAPGETPQEATAKVVSFAAFRDARERGADLGEAARASADAYRAVLTTA